MRESLALKSFKNPYLKWMNLGLVISGVSLLLLIGGFIIRRDIAPVLFIFGSMGVVAGVAIFLKCRKLARKVDKVLEGGFIVHWKYEPDEWQRFMEAEFPGQAGDISKTSPESYIWRGGIFINDRCYWFNWGRPHEVVYIPGAPSLIQFKWKESYKGGGNVERKLRVPVPSGQEEKSQEVVSRFGSTWKEELRRI